MSRPLPPDDNRTKIAILLVIDQVLMLVLTVARANSSLSWIHAAWVAMAVGQFGIVVNASWRRIGMDKALLIGAAVSMGWLVLGMVLGHNVRPD